jgi:hypothetical protein
MPKHSSCVCFVCVLFGCVYVSFICVCSVCMRLVSSHRLPVFFLPKRVRASHMHRKNCTECDKDDWSEGELYFTDVMCASPLCTLS